MHRPPRRPRQDASCRRRGGRDAARLDALSRGGDGRASASVFDACLLAGRRRERPGDTFDASQADGISAGRRKRDVPHPRLASSILPEGWAGRNRQVLLGSSVAIEGLGYMSQWYENLKRGFDLAAVLVLAIVLAFPLLIIAVLVCASSRGPALYWSDRVGQQQRDLPHAEVPLDVRRHAAGGDPPADERRRATSRRSADSFASPASTNCRNCGACSGET